MSRSFLAAVLLLSACGETAATEVITVEVERPDGTDALDAGDAVRVVVRTRVGGPGAEVVERVDDDPEDGFDLRFPLDDLDQLVRAVVAIETAAGERLLGAPPPFRPRETTGRVRVLVLPASTCAVVDGAHDVAFREAPALAVAGTFAVIAGGAEATGDPSPRAEFVDLLGWTGGPFEEGLTRGPATPTDPMHHAVGPARAVHLAAGRVLLLPDDPAITPLVLDISRATDRGELLELHAGAGAGSALTALRDATGEPAGAVVIGGGTPAAPFADVTWVAADGTIAARTRLRAPRSGAAASALDAGRVLVAGGTTGSPAVEIVSADTAEGIVALDAAEPAGRHGGALFAGPEAWLLIGGTDAAGAAIAATTILTGCADTCAARPGPDVDVAGALLVPIAGGGLSLAPGGGAAIEVQWVAATPEVRRLGALEVARDGGRAAALPSGQAIVAGDGPLEVCVPADLALP